jgi:hypothetical protein
MLDRCYPWLGDFKGLHMYGQMVLRSNPQHDKDDDLLWSKPKGLGTGKGLGIETKTDAAGLTGKIALACSHVVMGACHRCCSGMTVLVRVDQVWR